MSVKRHIQLESLAIILSAGILIGCGPSAEEQAATSVALTAAAATSTPRPTSTPTPIPGLLVPEDYLSIQDAIDAAEDGDSIVVSPGSYRENIDFSGKNITVRSTDPSNPEVVAATTIDGGSRGSVVTFQSGETAEARLEGFTITNGSFVNGGGILVDANSSPTIKDNTISDNLGQTGGGILVGDNSSPMISDNTIRGNQADFGSGIAVFESSPMIEGNIISGNVAEQNGGGMLVVVFSSPTIEGNIINGNVAGLNGGGIQVQRSSPTIKDNTISDNHAEQFGGGLLVINNSSPTISSNTISENQAAVRGGGILVGNSSPTISDNTISDNRAEWGGGIDVFENSSPTIENNMISDNQAKFGGGISVFDSSPTILGNTIGGNMAEQNAGGILVLANSSPTIKDNTISHNQAELTGGGIDVFDSSSPMVVGNEFQSNTAGIDGGAIWVGGDCTLILNESDDNIYSGNQPDDIYYSPPTFTQIPTSTPTSTSFPAFRDDFVQLVEPGWTWMNEDGFKWNMSEKPGFLRIYLSDKGELDQAENILLRNAPEGDFQVTTRVLFTPNSNFQFAGILIYQDDDHALKFGRAMCYLPGLPGRCVGNGLYYDNLGVDEALGGDEGYSPDDNFTTSTVKKSEAYLRVVREGRTYTASYSDDGINWLTIGRHVSDLVPFYVGLIASQAYEQPAIADFDYFTLEALP